MNQRNKSSAHNGDTWPTSRNFSKASFLRGEEEEAAVESQGTNRFAPQRLVDIKPMSTYNRNCLACFIRKYLFYCVWTSYELLTWPDILEELLPPSMSFVCETFCRLFRIFQPARKSNQENRRKLNLQMQIFVEQIQLSRFELGVREAALQMRHFMLIIESLRRVCYACWR